MFPNIGLEALEEMVIPIEGSKIVNWVDSSYDKLKEAMHSRDATNETFVGCSCSNGSCQKTKIFHC